jgi:hypothetical protein
VDTSEEDMDDEEERYIDYEGQDSYQTSEFKTPFLQSRPFGLDVSHMDKLQTYQVFRNLLNIIIRMSVSETYS